MLLFYLTCFSRSEPVYKSCSYLGNMSASISDALDYSYDAYAEFDETLNQTGWNRLRIISNFSSSDEAQMFCTGYLDGYLSANGIIEAYKNFIISEGLDSNLNSWNHSWTNFTRNNINYLLENYEKDKGDEYWKSLYYIYLQFRGMLKGVNERLNRSAIDEIGLWIFQAAGDFEDLSEILGSYKKKDPEFTLHCSAMVGLMKDYSDIFIGHDTWSSYSELHAVLKQYTFNISLFKAKKISFSTRTGKIGSIDDFWTADTGLLVFETTMHNFNQTSKNLISPASVLTWIRSYYAMLSSDNGRSWTENFIRENSGTYNNEYVVLDSKLFEPGKKPSANLLWMIEQFPGFSKSADITNVLIENFSFFGVNAPYFNESFDYADYPYQQEKEPDKKDFWSYWEQPRLLVFLDHKDSVNTYSDFQNLLRLNNYKDEKEKNYNLPEMGILSRYDLVPSEGNRLHEGPSAFGGLDSKTTSISRFKDYMHFDAINSPNYEQQEPFTFDNWNETPRYGLQTGPWKFGWQEFLYEDFIYSCYDAKTEDACLSVPGCGFCKSNKRCYSGNKTSPLLFRCESGWKFHSTNREAIIIVSVISSVVTVFIGFLLFSAYLHNKRSKEYKSLA